VGWGQRQQLEEATGLARVPRYVVEQARANGNAEVAEQLQAQRLSLMDRRTMRRDAQWVGKRWQ
jgi:hypothetical protein